MRATSLPDDNAEIERLVAHRMLSFGKMMSQYLKHQILHDAQSAPARLGLQRS